MVRVPCGDSASHIFLVTAIFSAETSHMATLQPSAISWRASSRPMPVPPPVTTAILPAKSFIASSLRWPALAAGSAASLAPRSAGVHLDPREQGRAERGRVGAGSWRARQLGGPAMKLYLAPGACSLADHIALHEA